MGLPKWMSNAWSGAKNIASKVGATAKKVGGKIVQGVKYVGKAAKPVLNVAKKIADVAEDIPGVVGDVAGMVNKGINKFNKWVDTFLPEGTVKDKLKEASGEASNLVNRGERYAKEKADQVVGYVHQTKPYINQAGQYVHAIDNIPNF